MEERTVLLSSYLSGRGYELVSIRMVWHPALFEDGTRPKNARNFRAFFANVIAKKNATGEIEDVVICPALATADRLVSFGYECDDLILEFLGVDIFGKPALPVVWTYARYGDTIVRCHGMRHDMSAYDSYAQHKLFEPASKSVIKP